MKRLLVCLLIALVVILTFVSCNKNDGTDGAQSAVNGENGKDGSDGKNGADGKDGEQGEKGDEGRGILSVEIINDVVWITYSDAPDTPVNAGTVSSGSINVLGLDFYPLPDGTYGVKAGNSLYLDTITIPQKFNGKSITKILPNAFENATNLKNITLPETVTERILPSSTETSESSVWSRISTPASFTISNARIRA